MKKYTDESIKSLTDTEHIRALPSGYVNPEGSEGIVHIIREVIDNSLDEISLTNNGELRLVLIKNMIDNEVICIVTDTGRGLPQSKMKEIFTTMRTSGKFDNDSYDTPSGMFGVGSTVTFTLSTVFRALSMRDNKIADLLIDYKDYDSKNTEIEDHTKETKGLFKRGSVVLFQPDTSVFSDMEDFLHSGWMSIKTLFEVINYFNKYKLFIHKLDLKPKEFNKLKDELFNQFTPKGLLKWLNDSIITNVDSILYSAISKSDKEKSIKEIIDVTNWRSVIHLLKPLEEITVNTPEGSKQVKMSIDMRVYTSLKNYELSKSTVSIINNVLFKNHTDTHIAEFRRVIKSMMAKYIKDSDVKKYFLEKYILPFYYICNLKFGGARFTGFTKSHFNDDSFRRAFNKWVVKYLKNKSEEIEKIYQFIEKDIISSFKQVRDNVNVSKSSRLKSQLNKGSSYLDCINYGPDSELFLCEGESAKSDLVRDSKFQAIYPLRGKPYNAITSKAEEEKSLNRLLRNDIFKDVFTILGIKPNSKNVSESRFGKIFIQTDADEHGKHIANLIIGNLWTYNPHIVRSGMVYIVLAPLYKLQLPNGNISFAKNKREYLETIIEEVYTSRLTIVKHQDGTTREVYNDVIVEEIVKLFEVGDYLTNIAKENNIPLIILEGLIITKLNKKLLTARDKTALKATYKYFNTDKILYSEESDTIIISYEKGDVYLHLNSINDKSITEQYISNNYHLTKYSIIDRGNQGTIDSAMGNRSHTNHELSAMGLYEFLSKINESIKYKRHEGIGSMDTEDAAFTCINPDTRVTFRIKSIGDANALYDYLGTDSTVRKELMFSLDK